MAPGIGKTIPSSVTSFNAGRILYTIANPTMACWTNQSLRSKWLKRYQLNLNKTWPQYNEVKSQLQLNLSRLTM